jgi:uncharacterized membrane protein YkvA (DUF1232 family)
MTQEIPDLSDMSGDELEESIRESAGGEVPRERAERFYDRVRGSIQRYLDNKGRMVEKTADFLLLAPDIFILLWRLLNDGRVSGKNKVLVGSGVAYFLFPFDLIPEAFVGPIGYLDDLVFGVYVLNRMLTDTDPEILREHWSGSDDVLETIHRVLNAADNLVSSEILGRIKKMVK